MDATEYAVLGKNLIAGNGYLGISGKLNMFLPPLYPLLIGISSLFVKNLELSGRLVSLLFGCLLIIPVYLFSKKMYSKKVAVIASILVVIHFSLVIYSTEVLTESTYTFLLTLGILSGYSALTRQKKFLYLLSGMIFGLCYLTRPEAIGYIAIIILLAFIFKSFVLEDHGKMKEWRKTLVCCIVLFIGFLVISSPYLLFLHNQTGRWTLGEKGSHTIVAGGGVSDPINSEQIINSLADDWKKTKFGTQFYGIAQQSMISYIISHPFELTKRYIINSGIQYLEFIPRIFPPLLILLVGIGLFWGKWTKERLKKEIYMFSFLVYPLLIYPLFFIEPRLLVPVLPIALIWSANGINELQNWFIKNLDIKKVNLWQRLFLRNIVLIIVILSLLPITAMTYINHKDYPIEYKGAGLWMKDHIPPSALIISGTLGVGFYAEKISLPLPYANYSQVLYYARYNNISYIVIDERFIPTGRPQLAFLLDETKAPKNDLKLVYKRDDTHYKILIYEMLYQNY